MARGYHDPAVHIVEVSRKVNLLRAALPDKVAINPAFLNPLINASVAQGSSTVCRDRQ